MAKPKKPPTPTAAEVLKAMRTGHLPRTPSKKKVKAWKSLAEFKRTGRVNKTIAKYLDRDTLELLTETQRLCRKLDAGKLTNAELCRFIDRLVPPAKQQIDINLRGPGGLSRSITITKPLKILGVEYAISEGTQTFPRRKEG